MSRRIRDLEIRLGVQLLNRTTRQVSLTDTDAIFYDSCLTLLAAVQAAEEAVSQDVAEIAGRLRITGPMSFGIHCLASAAGQFLERQPRLVIGLDLNDRVVDLVGDGFDLPSASVASRTQALSPGASRRFGTRSARAQAIWTALGHPRPRRS